MMELKSHQVTRDERLARYYLSLETDLKSSSMALGHGMPNQAANLFGELMESLDVDNALVKRRTDIQQQAAH
jgi:hypothetical protein